MIVSILLTGCCRRIGSFYSSGPVDHIRPRFVVISKLRSPTISSSCCVLHHRDILLIGPVNKIHRTGVSYSFFSPPTGPHHMVLTITSFSNTWVPHKLFFAYMRR